MIPMDVKGLTWVGNVYHKFEAMCLEVEEIMYQDTLKYVENQVDTVGASFKKFYSDVMTDIVPPSTDDPAKPGDSYSPALNYTESGRYRKPKTGIRQVSSRLVVEKGSDNSEVVTGVHENVGHASNLHRRRKINNLSANSSGDFAEGALSNLTSKQRTDDCLYFNKNLGVRQKLQKDSQGKRSRALPPLRKNSNTSSSLGKLSNDIHETPEKRMTVSSVPASVEVASLDPIHLNNLGAEKIKDHVHDTSPESLSYDVTGAVKSGTENDTGIRSSHGNMPETSIAAGRCATKTVASPACSLGDGDALCRVLSDDAFESSAGRIDDQHFDAEASYMNITNQVMEDIQRDVEVNLEDCVVVGEDELLYAPSKDGKQKVHKQGIRKVLSSRKNSARQKEYEQLARWYGKGGILKDCARENPTVLGKESKVPPTSVISETEWELL